jgi:transposase
MKYTIRDFQEQFKTDADCLSYVFAMRYPDGGKCECGRVGYFRPVAGRKSYACACGRQISPLEGTIFHKSPTSLKLWFHAIFLMSTGKNGVAAKELERQLGVTYKCAWRMAHQIRKLMNQGTGNLAGVVEADETFVGGRRRVIAGQTRPQGRNASSKTPVIGVVERGGEIRAQVSVGTRSSDVMPLIVNNVAAGSTVCTDEWNAYNYLSKYGFNHETVEHGDKEYVRGRVHTNTIEGFWSQLKRSINGTFHHVSGKHLQKYVDEFCYRYNRRKSGLPMAQHLLGSVSCRVGA